MGFRSRLLAAETDSYRYQIQVVTGIFPLKMCPPIGNDGSNLDDFVDAVYDPLMSNLKDDGVTAVNQDEQCLTPCASDTDCGSEGSANDRR